MADAAEHARVIFGAIVPDRLDLLELAETALDQAHFIDPEHWNFFSFLVYYSSRTNSVLTRDAISDQLRGRVDIGRILFFQELYDSFADAKVQDSDFRWSIQQLQELTAERATLEALNTGMQILRQGVAVKGGRLQGHKDARLAVIESLSDIDRGVGVQSAPEGDLRRETRQILDEYAQRAKAHQDGSSKGIRTGIFELDARLAGGFSPGELVLVAGYTSDGKSTMCVNGAWSAAVEQGKNVVVLTTETLRVQYNRKLVSRHSTQPEFGLPDGINSRDLKDGTVPTEQLATLKAVVLDLGDMDKHGALFVAQVPRGASVATCEAALHRYQRMFHVDVVYIDYLALLQSSIRRDSDREYLTSIIKEAKQLATTFDGGRGVPVISPWQVNRQAKVYANQNGRYESWHLAETAEASNSADVILALLAKDDGRDARVKNVLLQILKNRDGETVIMSPLEVRVDYGTSRFAAKESLGSAYAGPPQIASAASSSLYD